MTTQSNRKNIIHQLQWRYISMPLNFPIRMPPVGITILECLLQLQRTYHGLIEHSGTVAAQLTIDGWNHLLKKKHHLIVVGLEYPADLIRRHHTHPFLVRYPNIPIGNERDVQVAHAEFTSQRDFRVLGHVYDIPSHGVIPFALGFCAEAGSVDDHRGSAAAVWYPQLLSRIRADLAHLGAVGLSAVDVYRGRSVIIGRTLSCRPIDELIAEDESTGRSLPLERTAGARCDHPFDPQLPHAPDIGPIIDAMRRIRGIR